MNEEKLLSISLRPGQEKDLEILHSIRRKAWEVAYNHIYSQDEINHYFDGLSSERRTWSSIQYDHEETMVCYIGEMFLNNYDGNNGDDAICQKNEPIIGYVKWCFARNGKGEVCSLYVHPNYWNKKCGSLLWDYIMKQCGEYDVTSLDIWVLSEARSKEFYISKGCVEGQCGDYFIGEHKEKAICYRKFFHERRLKSTKQERSNDCLVVNVDVIVPVHNAEETIEETVHSAMQQTIPLHLLEENLSNVISDKKDVRRKYLDGYDRLSLKNVNLDLAVCCYDDGSSDKSYEILQRLKDHYSSNQSQDEKMTKRLLISKSNEGESRGAGFARNKAASLRKYSLIKKGSDDNKAISFVCLLDSDDIMHEHRTAEQVSVLLKMAPKERNSTLLGCTFQRIPEDSTWHYTNWANNLSDERLLLEKFREVTVLQPTWMITRHRFDLLGGYIDSLQTLDNVEHKSKHDQQQKSVYKLIHPIYDDTQSIRLAEDLRFFHAHLNHEEDQGYPGTLKLIRTYQPLLYYRHRVGQSQSSSTSRKLLLQLRTKALVDTVIRKDLGQWTYCDQKKKGGFVIWGAGRDGKDFFKSLCDDMKRNVRCFVDVDEKKIKSGYYVTQLEYSSLHDDGQGVPTKKKDKKSKGRKSLKIPIVHFSLLVRDDSKREQLQKDWMYPTTSTLDEENSGRISKENQSISKGQKKAKLAHDNYGEFVERMMPTRQLHGIPKKDKQCLKVLDELKDLPVVVCVAMYRSNGVLEKNVANIGRQESFDLWHFS